MRESRLVEEMLTVLEAAQHADHRAASGASSIIKEGLDNVRAMLAREDQGWEIFSGGNGRAEEGLTLNDLKAWAAKIHESAQVGWMKQGYMLRSTYIWQGGIHYDKIPSESRGRGVNVQDKIDDPLNQRAFFSSQAHMRREKRLYAEGLALWVGNDATKDLKVVPLDQVTGTLSDPDDESIIYAYKREWTHRKPDGEYEPMKRWYFVDTYKHLQTEHITVGGTNETVETGWTAFDMHANSTDGWKFGIPDALGAWIWNNFAKQLYMDGLDVSEAMASIVYLASGKTNAGAQNAANQFATATGAGGAAVVGAGNTLSAMSTAGKAFDFSQAREIIAVIATNLSVSNIALTSNPGDAGSSYGSAATLDLPVRLAMQVRRDEHVDLDLRVLRWMAGKNAGKDIQVYFQPYDDGAEVYRRLQAITLPWLQGVITDDKYKELAAGVLGLPDLGTTPDGVLIPNNIASMARRDIDKDGHGGTGSTSAPTQGRSSGLGDASGAPRDTRDDTIS
ncbi:hypothetical protein [Microbacterium sp. zg-YB36]|uniref:hypothetical protein n=1 Tax=Microbacterium sp. zg-YB36 TaxID=2969407 RepID=UPI00214B0725|nr:hypothetical protein [Microbacterium sp. zg-YB36]MDL5351207.1 hypothetical protein [Microbacterium sp. zg-YB36]